MRSRFAPCLLWPYPPPPFPSLPSPCLPLLICFFRSWAFFKHIYLSSSLMAFRCLSSVCGWMIWDYESPPPGVSSRFFPILWHSIRPIVFFHVFMNCYSWNLFSACSEYSESCSIVETLITEFKFWFTFIFLLFAFLLLFWTSTRSFCLLTGLWAFYLHSIVHEIFRFKSIIHLFFLFLFDINFKVGSNWQGWKFATGNQSAVLLYQPVAL